MTQQTLGFFGPDVNEQDAIRLAGLMGRVESYMRDGKWATLAEISYQCRGAEASVSARLRDLRRKGYVVERERTEQPGVFRYRAVRP